MHDKSFSKSKVGGSFKTYLNQFIKSGENFSVQNVKNLNYSMYVKKYYDEKVISKLKSAKGREAKEQERDELVKQLISYDKLIINLVEFMQGLVSAKSIIVTKLNKVKQLTDIFIRTSNGYEVSNPEGYVAIDKSGKGAVKLVDRLEFSYNNFTAAKNWDK